MALGFQALFCLYHFFKIVLLKIQTFLEKGNQALSLYSHPLSIYSACILDPLQRDLTPCSHFDRNKLLQDINKNIVWVAKGHKSYQKLGRGNSKETLK